MCERDACPADLTPPENNVHPHELRVSRTDRAKVRRTRSRHARLRAMLTFYRAIPKLQATARTKRLTQSERSATCEYAHPTIRFGGATSADAARARRRITTRRTAAHPSGGLAGRRILLPRPARRPEARLDRRRPLSRLHRVPPQRPGAARVAPRRDARAAREARRGPGTQALTDVA